MQARTLFLSDIHLGFRRARVAELLAFLRTVEAEQIVLVGDIVDAISLARRAFWSDGHTQVLRVLLAKRRAGARLIYLPGNHDASLAMFAELLRGQLEVHREWVHRTARGERLLVLHGDQFDAPMSGNRFLHRLGDALYDVSVALNGGFNDLRRLIGRSYWPLAERVKLAIGASARYIARFEQVAAAHARHRGFDGVVCGHIHRARMCQIDGTFYGNTGDWVECCSAIVEAPCGQLQLWRAPAASPCDRSDRSPGRALPLSEVSL
jgi:UDP-2,3-diacylglucosamine pyrophosphatase LpxH